MKSILIIFIGILSTTLMETGFATHHPHSSHKAIHNHRHELPKRVIVRLSDRYHHFDLIHTTRVSHRGHLSFDVLLQHGNRFLEVSISERGRIYGETSYRQFPLVDHYCDDQCNFQYGHYDDQGLANYDPYYGCEYHNNLISSNYRNYRYRPYYGLSWVHYHPEYRVYKRFRYNRASARGYYIHNKPHRRYQNRHYRYGPNRSYGKKKYRNEYGYSEPGQYRKGNGNRNGRHDHQKERRYSRKNYKKGSYDDRAYQRHYHARK